MPLRPFVPFVAATLLAAPALAQDSFLSGSPVQCAALESLVVYGLIDGGEGGDTTGISQIIDNGDGRACFFELETYGYGAGMQDDTCVAAMEIIAAYGAPEDWTVGASEIVANVLLGDAMTCAELLYAYGP